MDTLGSGARVDIVATAGPPRRRGHGGRGCAVHCLARRLGPTRGRGDHGCQPRRTCVSDGVDRCRGQVQRPRAAGGRGSQSRSTSWRRAHDPTSGDAHALGKLDDFFSLSEAHRPVHGEDQVDVDAMPLALQRSCDTLQCRKHDIFGPRGGQRREAAGRCAQLQIRNSIARKVLHRLLSETCHGLWSVHCGMDERKQLEACLQRAVRVRSQKVAIAGHEQRSVRDEV
mmetsp:Transcript_12809/g.40892  ORF Transcript_12809/g.40892 Transcript_12809/m.40892 type:complete len:227 (-) Transcript_12809:191-871(-)